MAMEKTYEIITPGGCNPPSSEVGPLDSGGDQLLSRYKKQVGIGEKVVREQGVRGDLQGNEIPATDTQVGKSGVNSAYEWWKGKDPSDRRSCLRRTPPSPKGVAVTDREVEDDPCLVKLFNFMGSDTPVSKVQGDNSGRRQREREGSRMAKRPREEISLRTFTCVEVEIKSEAI